MALLNQITGKKRCANAKCNERDPAAFGKWRGSKDGLYRLCKKCASTISRKYKPRYKDKIKAANSKYYAEHREELLMKGRAWEKANPEKVAAKNKRRWNSPTGRAFKEAYKEKARENYKKWLAKPESKEKIRQYNDKWIAKNPEKKLAQVNRRRALKETLPSLWLDGMWQECLEAFNGCCAYCGLLKDEMEGDHFVPISARWLSEGTERPGHVPWNIVPACMSCNRSKVHKEPIKWLTQTGRIDRLPAILEHLRAMRKKYDLA